MVRVSTKSMLGSKFDKFEAEWTEYARGVSRITIDHVYRTRLGNRLIIPKGMHLANDSDFSECRCS